MDFEIVWTEPASTDLEEIVKYIMEDSPQGAERVANAILEKVETLKTFPQLGAIYPRARDKRVREVLSGKYRIFYRVLDNAGRVEVLRIWHGVRREPRFLS
jgi:toxin ParE1/3/4